MLKLGFGGKVKPKVFDYKPMHYDPAKEELQEKIKKYRDSDDGTATTENMKNRIKSGLRMKYNGDPTARSKAVKQSNLRLLYIIAMLAFAGYIILSSNKIIALMETFSK
jgi:hypothetical protein